MDSNLLYKDITFQILGACFEVYKEKGNGYLEDVYQECLALEFASRGIIFTEKPKLILEYKGSRLRQYYQPDFICHEKIILELKAVKTICDEHRAQVINYLKSTGNRLGLLINFGHYPKIEHERFAN